jgi:YbgC/YbaW family acyl-CoA thioester hydrolase
LIAQGSQEIVTVDNKTMRAVATAEGVIDRFRMPNPRILPHRDFPSLQSRADSAYVYEREVEWRDLDAQEHVNNANYPAFAEDAAARALAEAGWAPSAFRAEGLAVASRRIHIRYQTPAAWGERLRVVTQLAALNPTGGVWHIGIERAADREAIAQCVLEWSLMDSALTEKRPLPASLSGTLAKKLPDGASEVRPIAAK